MSMNKIVAIVAAAGTAATVVAGAIVGYKLATDEVLRKKIVGKANAAYQSSKAKVSGMSEDVVVRTAQLKRDPKINQEWVAQQWEYIGY